MSDDAEGDNQPVEENDQDHHLSTDVGDPSSSLSIASSWSGPIPPPYVFAEYGKISPDMPERIMRMIEAENQYRREQSARIERFDRISSIARLAGLLFGTILTAVVAFTLRAQQEDILAIIITVTPIFAVIVALGMNMRSTRRRKGAQK